MLKFLRPGMVHRVAGCAKSGAENQQQARKKAILVT